MSTTANAVKANLEIVANLVDSNGHKHAVPDIHNPMKFEDTVHYSSPDGEVRIEFFGHKNLPPLSPFLEPNGSVKTVITSKEPPIKLSEKGEFFCHCFITPPGKDPIGWRSNDPLSGGNHEVR